MEQIIYYDEYGRRYCKDENGNKIPPMQAEIIREVSGWKEYDTSQGHCGLCGRLTCNGNCFK